MVYEPREDSYLMELQVRRLARGDVLDMGTGSGIQGRAALSQNRVSSVLFSDIDQEAIDRLKEAVHDTRASFAVSDLFERIQKTFDTIVFNPPYLPDDPRVKETSLDGGPNGYEVAVRFIGQAKAHLRKDGMILLLISSLTGKRRVELALQENGFIFSIIAEKHIDFETLYVYEVGVHHD
ncbi:MAG: methyltransferase [DPANN group archaeon]|nr:methyltransferase [DPANN group archaeon]